MNSTGIYRLRSSAILPAAALFVSLATSAGLRAQNQEIVPRLPASTVAFVEWHGSNALSATAQSNHVIQLMSDPAMAPVWLDMAASFERRQQESKAPPPVLSMPEVVSLLQNPAVFGIAEMPRGSESGTAEKPAARMGVFLVYDASGKTELIQKWETGTETRRPGVQVSHFNAGGTSVEVRSSGKGKSYLAQAGNYFVVSDQKPVIEELIKRFGSSARPANSITQRPEYAEVKKFVDSGAALDFFARMPNLDELTPAGSKSQSGAEFVHSMHLEKVRAAGGSVSFASPAMHMRGVIFGNTQPAGPFDMAGSSSTSFSTMAIAGGAPEFSVSRMNFAAVYQLFYSAIVPNLPAQQAANLAVLENAAQGFLGMSIPDALSLFTGEVASASSYSADGTEERLFAATIQHPESVLHILRAVLGPMTLAEDTDGNATTLDLAVPYRDPATGVQRRKLYYVAVTPGMLLAAPRKAMLRETLQRISAGSTGPAPAKSGVFVDPQYAQLRALLPQKLSGLSAEDFSQIPWASLLASLQTQAQTASLQGALQAAQPQNPQAVHPPDLSWLKLVNPKVIPQHLHIAVGGWWKDTNGVYFDSYVQ